MAPELRRFTGRACQDRLDVVRRGLEPDVVEQPSGVREWILHQILVADQQRAVATRSPCVAQLLGDTAQGADELLVVSRALPSEVHRAKVLVERDHLADHFEALTYH